MSRKYTNILVNALVNLGDVVLTTSAIALLKKAYPEARITMLVRPVVREAVENNPVIDDVILFDYKAKTNSFGSMWEMVKLLRSRKFDLSISFDRKSRPALLCWLAGIPTRVGPDRVFDDKPSKVTWLYTHTMRIKHDLVNTLQAETYQEIIRQFTGQTEHTVPVMANIPKHSYQKALDILKPISNREVKIALCVKGTFELKTWPKEYFVQVVQALKSKYAAGFCVVGAPNDREYAAEVIEACQTDILNLCGQTTLLDLAALFQQCDLLVTVDTGAAHIAATTGVKMVTMYGCTTPNRWHPYNANAQVLSHNIDCCPCSVRPEQCPSWPKPECLWAITPDMVLAKCDELMA